MNVRVQCYTGIKPLTEVTHTFHSAMFDVELLAITRQPCGTGKAANRYHYLAFFISPEGTIDIHGKDASGRPRRANLVRRSNPKWKPPVDGWDGFVWNRAKFAELCTMPGGVV